MKKAFTLIELLIVIVIVGILSTLLFRTMGDMISANSRVQQENILAQELITIQTSLNHIAEQYPYLDEEQYKTKQPTTHGFVTTLYLTNLWGDQKISISGTGDCSESCYLQATDSSGSIALTNAKLTKISNIIFKLLPIEYYTGSQYTSDLWIQKISQPWFWLFWNLRNNLKNGAPNKVSYTLQHFINLQEKPLDLTTLASEHSTQATLQEAQEESQP